MGIEKEIEKQIEKVGEDPMAKNKILMLVGDYVED